MNSYSEVNADFGGERSFLVHFCADDFFSVKLHGLGMQFATSGGGMMSSNQPAGSALPRKSPANFGTLKSDFGTVAVARGGFLQLPAKAWARIQVLFLALAIVKIFLLLGLRKHLFEIHWRVAAEEPTVVGTLAFYVFVMLGVYSLVELGSCCRRVGIRATRAANFIVLGLGLLFIFFNFHTGDKKYLYPILEGTLKWQSLGPYLSLDLFFRAPFLGAWLGGYALYYYALARGGRESVCLYLTAACAGAYAIFFLRELATYRNELLVADCLGLVSLLVARIPGKLRLSWQLVPFVWSAAFAVGMFCLAAPHVGYSLCYFLMVLIVALAAFSLALLCAWRRSFLRSWSSLHFFYFVSFLLLANAEDYPWGPNYSKAICLGLELPRYFMGELLITTLGALALGLYCRIWPQAKLWWFDALSLVLIAMAFVDFRLSQIMGVRLDWDLLMFGNSPKMMWRMAEPYLGGVALALCAVLVIYALAIRGLEMLNRRGRPSAGDESTRRGPWYAFASFLLLGLLGLAMATADKGEGQSLLRLAQTSPVWRGVSHRRLSREEFLRSTEELGMGNLASPRLPAASQPPRDLNVVLVFMESSYNKHLSLFGGKDETQPLLSRYKDRMEVFPNFFSNFAGSIQARFAAFTSLYPVRDFNKFTRDRVAVKSIFEVMHDNGYSCSLFYSSYFDYTGFGDFLRQRGIDEMYDCDSMPGRRKTERISWGLEEGETLTAMRSRITKYAGSGQKFFLTYVPAAPHYPYDCVPSAFHKYAINTVGDYTPSYLNELLYVDYVLAGIVDQLKDTGLLDKTLVIITDDHGEMTGENGGPIGHGWVVTPELANAPLIIMDPGKSGYRTNYTVGSQVDLLPTILDLLKLPIPANQLYQGRTLYGSRDDENRMAYLNSYEQYGVITGDKVMLGSRKTEEGGKLVAPKTAYAISNQGCKTVFTGNPASTQTPLSIGAFDEFQENFLRDYSYYCETILGKRMAANNQAAR